MIRHFQCPWYCRIGLGIILIRVSYTVVAEANVGRSYRLVDGPSTRPNIGRVQIQQDNYWTDACFLESEGNEAWDFNNLTMICEKLGYPGALKSTRINSCEGDSSCSPETTFTYCPESVYVQAVCAAPGYVGCFFETFGTDDRLLPDLSDDTSGQPRLIDKDGMTIKKCIAACRELGDYIRYAGLEARSECFCGTAIRKQRFQFHRRGDSECEYSCPGDAFDVCGGEFRLSIYDIALGKCNDPGVPDNGYIIKNPVNPNGTFAFGGIIIFGCNDAFALEGYSSIQCVPGISANESAWNGSIPTCGVLSTPSIISPPQSTPEFKTGNTIGIVAGASVGAILFLVVIVILLLYLFKIRKSDPSEETDLDAYEIPTTLSDQTPNNQNVSIPADMTDNATYTGLDGSTRQPESVYQGVRNRDPDNLTRADNYQSLDATSRLSAADYQGIYHDVKTEEHNDQDDIYHEYMDPMAASAKSQSPVPIPPRVTGMDNSNSMYVNVKEATNNPK